MARTRRGRGGFTLMEMLLAMVIAGILLTYAAFEIVSLSNIWAHRSDEDFFAEHVDGVVHFLDASFEQAYGPKRPTFKENTANSKDNNDSDNQDADQQQQQQDQQDPQDSGSSITRNPANTTVDPNGLSLDYPPGAQTFRAPYIHFAMEKPPPLLSLADVRGVPGVQAWLMFDERRGLALLWYAPLLITDDREIDERDVHSTLLSPYVTALKYVYRDPKSDQWNTYDELQEENGKYKMPDFLQLTFKHDEDEEERLIRIPTTVTIPDF